MIRSILITINALALLFSSLGLSEVVHWCAMRERAATVESCPACADLAVHEDVLGARSVVTSPPCCRIAKQLIQASPAGAFSRHDLTPAPALYYWLFVERKSAPVIGQAFGCLTSATAAGAARRRRTYLHISSFLI